MTTVRYWAAARAAAGTSSEDVAAETLSDALDDVRGRHGERLTSVLAVCAFLVDGEPVGTRDHASVLLGGAALVDVLPPFAGG